MSQDHRMTTRFQEQRRHEETLHAVLNNQLVSENIASFLSLPDMKAAFEVSHKFLQALRGTRRFAQTAVLTITDENLEDVKSFITKTNYKWRGVKVDVKDPANILDDLRRVLNSAEFVSLEERPWMNEDRAVKDTMAVSLLTAVFSSTPNLSKLELDIRFLYSNVGEVLSSPAVQQTLRNLSRLELGEMWKCKSSYWDSEPLCFNSEKEDTFMRNFGLLTGLPNRLKCFKLCPISEKSVDSLHRPVLRVLRNNNATLEELELHLSVWRIQELQLLTFPVLKALTASVDKLSDGDKLGLFLKNQRSLEDLTLTSTWSVGVGGAHHMKTGIKECCVGLQKLHLTVQWSSPWDWRFLAAMNRLKDFQLKMWGGFHSGNRILASLPKNQLECLSLEGFFYKSDTPCPYLFWRLGEVKKKNEFRYKTELLEGFRCVRKLSFLGSRGAVDDQLMQWILKEFVSLEELQLSDCSKLTDAGITGKTTADWGRDASFTDLRRLQTLKIVRCYRVTPNGVLASCVNVRSLRSLEYSNPEGPIEESLVLKLVGQNPGLERLSLDYRGDLGKLKAKVLKKNPRVELLLAHK